MRLTVETGPLAGTVVHLERDRPMTLGSGADCALRIQEAGVVEQHAIVKALKGEGFGIKALEPVRVNGAEVQASPLNDGDVIEIGTTRIAYGDVQQSGLPQISGYRILDQLGKGGMGTVYRAEQVSLSREVALKVLRTEQTQDANFVGQFVAEAQAAAKLHHPNVVSVFDVEHDGDTYFYSMELMHEGSCEDWLRQNGTMPVERALEVIADSARGLAYAESLGIVHRDIKPDNLMLDQHGAVKIADLGLASASGSGKDEAHAIGTPHFMAPEQVLKQELDHRTDLYALGCTFYRLVTGRTPFRGQTVKDILRAQVKDDPELASRAHADVPGEVAEIISRLMQKEPGQRYQTANDLIEDLEALLQPPQKRGMWIGLAVAGALVAGGAIYWGITKPKEKEIVERVKMFDDPEKQKFADRIVVLEAEAKQKDARIALLSTRVSGLSGDELADALDRVARQHGDTSAATDATQLAGTIRREAAQRREQLAQRSERIADHVAEVRRATLAPLDAHDYARAIAALDVKPPQELAEEPELAQSIERLRTEIAERAEARLQSLLTPLETAQQQQDEAAIQTALVALNAELTPKARWPESSHELWSRAVAASKSGTEAVAAMKLQRREGVWQSYGSMLREADGLSAQLANLAFGDASRRLRAFAGGGGGGNAGQRLGEAAERAANLATLTEHAEQFAKALQRTCSEGSLETRVDDVQMKVRGWDRSKREFAVDRSDRRRSKADTLAAEKLTLEHWFALTQGVPSDAAPPGARESFLALLALRTHAAAAQIYLGKLEAGNDDSGVGEAGYPYSAVMFDRLQASAAGKEQPWSVVLDDEIAAGQRLAAGLRALTERRNLAAAGHIDRLLADHPHSLVVALLP
ncbi:MAG: protein kinase [Planctomycetota bacterium]